MMNLHDPAIFSEDALQRSQRRDLVDVCMLVFTVFRVADWCIRCGVCVSLCEVCMCSMYGVLCMHGM